MFLLQYSMMILGIVLVAGAVNPWVFLPLAPLLVIFAYLHQFYIKGARDVKRLEGIGKAFTYYTCM